MSLKNDIELVNTQAKLARLKLHYESRRREASNDKELREATLESLKRTIDQLKEEIDRYKAGSRRGDGAGAGSGGAGSRELRNERELANTREKLRMLEETCEEARADSAGDSHVRELSRRSLKRMINQLKEEIARYEARHAVRR